MAGKKPVADDRKVVEFGMTRHFAKEADMRAQMARHQWPFYVYALCDPLGCVFYVGKGQKGRIFDHAAEAHKGGKNSKCEMIRLLGNSLRYAILLSCADEETALIFEARVLEGLWDAKTLTNIKLETVEAVIDAVANRNPVAAAMRSLARTLKNIQEIEAQTERDALNAVRRWPYLIHDLFPAGLPRAA
jgi:hypothetical protein